MLCVTARTGRRAASAAIATRRAARGGRQRRHNPQAWVKQRTWMPMGRAWTRPTRRRQGQRPRRQLRSRTPYPCGPTHPAERERVDSPPRQPEAQAPIPAVAHPTRLGLRPDLARLAPPLGFVEQLLLDCCGLWQGRVLGSLEAVEHPLSSSCAPPSAGSAAHAFDRGRSRHGVRAGPTSSCKMLFDDGVARLRALLLWRNDVLEACP